MSLRSSLEISGFIAGGHVHAQFFSPAQRDATAARSASSPDLAAVLSRFPLNPLFPASGRTPKGGAGPEGTLSRIISPAANNFRFCRFFGSDARYLALTLSPIPMNGTDPAPVTWGSMPFHFSIALRLASIFLSSIRSVEILALCSLSDSASAFAVVIF